MRTQLENGIDRRSFMASGSVCVVAPALLGSTAWAFRNPGPEPFIGEIGVFAGNFAPRNWAFCDGQLLQISQNTALFSLLGTTYGGDGRTTFGLPDLQARSPMQHGNGPGLTPRHLGERGGSDTVTLTLNQIPLHTHTALGNPLEGDSTSPMGRLWAKSGRGDPDYGDADGHQMSTSALATTGGSAGHLNMQPYLAVNFIIALVGLYPSRN